MALPQDGATYTADDGTVSTVLADEYDPNYEPSQKELQDYAKWIGIDTDSEAHLMWIAREGLRAPLPDDWKMCRTDTGDTYYFNFSTGDSLWDHPLDDEYKQKVINERQRPGTQQKKNFGKKSKKEKTPKLERGAGGNASNNDSKPISQNAVGGSDFKPKVGRLSSIGGTDGGSGAVRPDISDLLPGDSQPMRNPVIGGAQSGGLFGSKPALGTNTDALKAASNMQAEEEQRFRAKLQHEHEDLLQGIMTQHRKQLEMKEEELDHDRRRLERQLEDELDDAVRAARRRVEQRTSHELRSYEQSINRERDDNQRKLQDLEQQLQATIDNSRRRVESELATKRRQQDSQVSERAQRRIDELERAWMREKSDGDQRLEHRIRDLNADHSRTMDRLREEARSAMQRRLLDADNHLSQQLTEERARIRKDKERRLEELRQEIEVASRNQSDAVRTAENEMMRAVSQAREDKENQIEAERQKAAEALRRLSDELEAQRQRAQETAASERSNNSALSNLRATLQQTAAARLRDQEQVLENERKLKEAKMIEETAQLVEKEKRAIAEEATSKALADSSQQERDAEMERSAEAAAKAKYEAAEREQLQQVRAAHDTELSQLQSELATEKRSALQRLRDESSSSAQHEKDAWLLDHPQPAPPPSSAHNADDALRIALEDERTRLAKAHESKIADLKQHLESERKAVSELHRKKALREMDERLSRFRGERAARTLAEAKEQERLQASAKIHVEPEVIEEQDTIYETTPPPLTAAAQLRIDTYRQTMQQRYEALKQALTAPNLHSSCVGGNVPTLPDLPPRPDTLPPYKPPDLPPISVPELRHPPPQPLHQSHVHQQHNGGLLSISNSPAHPHGANAQPTSSQIPPPAPVISRATSHGAIEAHSSPEPRHQHHHHGEDRHRDSEKYLAEKEKRIAAAHEHVKRKKAELRQRQADLEDARAEWKRDMARAKQSGNQKQQEVLYVAKGVLEERARVLNEETLGVKKSVEWLKKHASKHGLAPAETHHQHRSTSHTKHAQHQHFDPSMSGSLGALGGGDMATPLQHDPNLLEVLQQVASKVASVEASMQKVMQSSSRHHSPNGRHSKRGGGETGGTVERWLRETDH